MAQQQTFSQQEQIPRQMQATKHHTTAIASSANPTMISASCHGSNCPAASRTEVAASSVKSVTESRTEVQRAEAESLKESPMMAAGRWRRRPVTVQQQQPPPPPQLRAANDGTRGSGTS
eukprot:GHVS01051751.1.p2 GENE.GHVS01051751.1~~GHVS01051751.1.p2  ORF type:complete len:119 (-),score=36.81 GHVS01051751.1:365-721(-)